MLSYFSFKKILSRFDDVGRRPPPHRTTDGYGSHPPPPFHDRKPEDR